MPERASTPIVIVVLMTIITLTILMILIRDWEKKFTEGAREDHLQHSHCATSYWTSYNQAVQLDNVHSYHHPNPDYDDHHD